MSLLRLGYKVWLLSYLSHCLSYLLWRKGSRHVVSCPTKGPIRQGIDASCQQSTRTWGLQTATWIIIGVDLPQVKSWDGRSLWTQSRDRGQATAEFPDHGRCKLIYFCHFELLNFGEFVMQKYITDTIGKTQLVSKYILNGYQKMNAIVEWFHLP